MKDDILLVHLPDTPMDGSKPVFTPPIGLWSMRTNNFGKKVRVLDANIHRDFVERADIAGYSIMFPEHIRYLDSARSCIYAKKEVLGGPTGGNTIELGMESIRGPGENWLAEKAVSFSLLRPPEFSRYEMDPYWKLGAPFSGLPSTSRWMPVETSRGCPNECGFCAIPSLWGRWIPRPLEALDEYFTYLIGEHQVEEIIVIDDNIAVSAVRFIAIIELFKKYGLSWSITNGIYNRSLLRLDVQEAIKDSRCLYLSLPFEAGNQHTANLMNLGKKYLTFEEAMQLTNKTKELGIHTAGQFVIGYPGETEEDVRETLKYANALSLDQRHIHIATPFKGTPMYETCEKNNYLADSISKATYKIPVIETPMLSREVLYKIWKEDRENALQRKEGI